ncbi:MAG TPA: endonuclease domain-containing protein [Allosphingosinicella sp.]|nr:endonuclease domain-containing protein [Allosphingosinicella sp.]
MRVFFLLSARGMGVVRRNISPHAGPLRQAATDAERALWRELRARRLGGHKFRRQWTIGPYIADFCCLERRLVVEADGGQHSPEGDRSRTNYLRANGFRILRFWNNDALRNMDGVLISILEALEDSKKEDPHPDLFPQAGEGA